MRDNQNKIVLKVRFSNNGLYIRLPNAVTKLCHIQKGDLMQFIVTTCRRTIKYTLVSGSAPSPGNQDPEPAPAKQNRSVSQGLVSRKLQWVLYW